MWRTHVHPADPILVSLHSEGVLDRGISTLQELPQDPQAFPLQQTLHSSLETPALHITDTVTSLHAFCQSLHMFQALRGWKGHMCVPFEQASCLYCCAQRDNFQMVAMSGLHCEVGSFVSSKYGLVAHKMLAHHCLDHSRGADRPRQ